MRTCIWDEQGGDLEVNLERRAAQLDRAIEATEHWKLEAEELGREAPGLGIGAHPLL